MDSSYYISILICSIGAVAAALIINKRPVRFVRDDGDEPQLPDKGALKEFFRKASARAADSSVDGLYSLYALSVKNTDALAILSGGRRERQLTASCCILPLVVLYLLCTCFKPLYLCAVPASALLAWIVGKARPRGEYRDPKVAPPEPQPDYENIVAMTAWIESELRRIGTRVEMRCEIAELRRKELDGYAFSLSVFAGVVLFFLASFHLNVRL